MTHLLTLPDELFLSKIFPYLHSTDLMRAFCALGNYRLVSLVYIHIRHLDLPEEIHCLRLLQRYRWRQIRALRITEKHLSKKSLSVFPMIERLDVTMTSLTTRALSSSLLSLFTRMKTLNLAFSNLQRFAVDNRFARYIWHADSRLQSLSISNCILMDETYFLTASSSMVPNRYLTCLALVVVDLWSTVPLLSLTPALQHLRIRLCGGESWSTSHANNFFESPQRSLRIRSLRLTAPGCLSRAHYLCEYIRVFAASLQHLAIYAHLVDSYMMRGRGNLERCLLNDLPELQRLDFCICSGIGMRDSDDRRTFDRWARQRHVISIFHPGLYFHTRFTLPFAFNRLERVTNSWLHFHSNEFHANFILSLPSVTSISFLAKDPLNIELIRLIKRACPQLQRVDFQTFCHLHDDLIRDTELIFPNVKQLRLRDLHLPYRDVTFQYLFRLLPNIERLTVDATELPEIDDAISCSDIRFATIRQLIIVESPHYRAANRQAVVQQFPNARILYRTRSY